MITSEVTYVFMQRKDILQLDCANWDDLKTLDASAHAAWGRVSDCEWSNDIDFIMCGLDDDQQEVVAFLCGHLLECDFSRDFKVIHLAVLPEYQGQGIGSAMLGILYDWCEKNDVESLFSFVGADNFEVMNFFDANGFEVAANIGIFEGRRMLFYGLKH